MATKLLLPTGGLNLDDDPSTLPDGDYIDAENISTDVGLDGQDNTFRKLEGFLEVDADYVMPFTMANLQVVDACADHENRAVYYLCRGNTYAAIFKYDIATDTKSVAMPRYAHGGYSGETGNLRIIGQMLFWNYLSYNGFDGVPCSWYLPRSFTNGSLLSTDVLLMAKPAPGPSTANYEAPIEITSIIIDTTSNVPFLSENDFQFSYRFVYDSGERSVLCQPYQLFKGRENVQSIGLEINNEGNSYVEKYEIYARKGNNGVWYRITTLSSGTTSYTWGGSINEVLSDDDSTTFFHFIPQETEAIEIALNRVFLGNNLMDLNSDVSNLAGDPFGDSDTNIIIDTSGTSVVSYFNRSSNGADTVDHPANTNLNINDNADWVMPFTYGVFSFGLAFFDDAMRTPGVIFSRRVSNTFLPFNVKLLQYRIVCGTPVSIPSWAKYAAVCVTKNLMVDSFYEGYANNVFFEFESGDSIYFNDQVTDDNIAYAKRVIIDVSSMINDGHIYTFQDGDRIILGYFVSGTFTTREFVVEGTDGKYIYVEFKGDTIDGMINGMSNFDFFFRIYSPSDSTENLVYYPNTLFKTDVLTDGEVIDFGHLDLYNIGKMQGDGVFKTIKYRPYLTNPLITTPSTTEFARTSYGKLERTVVNNTPFSEELDSDVIFENNCGGTLINVNRFTPGKDFSEGGKISMQFKLEILLGSSFTDGDLLHLFLVADNPTQITALTETLEKVIVLESGKTTYSIDFYHEGDLTDTNLVEGDEVRIIFTAQNDGSAIDPVTYTFTEFKVSLYDNSQPVDVKTIDPNVPVADTAVDVLVVAMNLNDNLSWARHHSMPLLEVPSSDPVRKITEVRHGGSYIQDLLINNISNFTALLRDNIPYENGAITALERASKSQSQGNVLLAFTKNETCSIYLGERQIRDAGDSNQLALTDTIIGTINTLQGSYGTSDPRSIAKRMGSVYFWDALESKVIRYNRNGLVCISGKVINGRDPDSKMKKFFRGKTGSPIAMFDPFNEMYIIWFDGDSDERPIAWSENRNRWTTFLKTYAPRVGVFVDDYLYSLHVDSFVPILSRSQDPDAFAVFPDSASPQDCSISFVMSTPVPIMLENITIRHNSDVIDWARDNNIKDNLIQIVINNENGQQTTIYEEMLMLEKNMLYSHILRDENSAGGLIEGEFMEGYKNIIKVILDNTNSDEQLAIVVVSIGYSESAGHKL